MAATSCSPPARIRADWSTPSSNWRTASGTCPTLPRALAVPAPIAERPANTIRSVTRLFTSDVEDKPWYNDREMWPRYLTMLATQRFNRFNLSFGIGYDFLRSVTDAYFLFAYPFLLDVPGYHVRVPQLPDAERDRNLEMLQFISEQTVARGLEFQLGIWMHGYEWINSPHPNYTIEGLTAETHGPYCRDAVRALLKACPAVSGVTFRIHGESGVEEGSYQFWKTVFEGVATCGRKVEIDMHAKGMDQTMMDTAVATGLPIKISPKYWAEHFGMPYHQADIREVERPKPGREGTGLMKLSAGSRSFLRYGYGDLLREDRKWGVLHRIWPGTQTAAAVGRPVDRGRPLPRVPLLRQRRRRNHGAAFLQGPPGLRHRRQPHGLCRPVPRAALGLGEVRIRPPYMGPPALQSRCRARRLAALHDARTSAMPARHLLPR